MARKAKAEMVITCEEPKKTPPKLKVDDITPLEPLTDNQVKFFKAYDRGDYFMILHGVPGSGKCQGENVEVNLMVSDELYEKLKSM